MSGKKIAKRVAIVSLVVFGASKLFLKKSTPLAAVSDLPNAS